MSLSVFSITKNSSYYRGFHSFGQAKFPDSGLDLGSSQFFNTAPAASVKDAWFKSGQNRLKNMKLALLISILDTLCSLCIRDLE